MPEKLIESLLSILMCFSICVSGVHAEETELPGRETETEEKMTELSAEEGAEEARAEDPLELIQEEPHSETEPQESDEADMDQEDAESQNTSFEWDIPEGFVPGQEDQGKRQNLREHESDRILTTLTAGKDYTENELLLTTDSYEYAEAAAAIYHGEISSFSGGLAVIELKDPEITVEKAVLAAIADESLPVVGPNYITAAEPEPTAEETGSMASEALKEYRDWDGWIRQSFTKPDPFLSQPASRDYQWFHDTMHTWGAWNASMGNRDITVAVIDSGVNPNHEDLAGKVERADGGYGTDLIAGHGTSVAGCIAAIADNGVGGAGIAPDVSILGIDIFGTNKNYQTKHLIRALNLAMEKNVDIINMSLGGTFYDEEVNAAVQKAYQAGITMVASAGNNGSNLTVNPSCYDHVICVAASDRNNHLAGFSNYGPWVDVSAPGEGIYTTSWTEENPDSSYDSVNGTSFSAPLVSGALALYMSRYGHISPDESMAVLKRSCERGEDEGMGAGILNVEKMFASERPEAVISFYDRNGQKIEDLKSPLPEGASAGFTVKDSLSECMILYTADGTKPAVKNGQTVRGTLIQPGTLLSLDSFEKGKRLKLTAAAISPAGVAGKAVSFTVTTYAPQPAREKIKSLKLDRGSVKLKFSASLGIQETAVLLPKDASGKDLDLSAVAHQWISSDSAVAEVSEEGLITPKKAGTAKVTLRLLDGSKKSASCTVRVVQLESLTISGQNSMSSTSSAVYKAILSPSVSKGQNVTWSIAEPVPGVSVNRNTGRVTVKGAEAGQSFTLVAVSDFSDRILAEKTIRIAPKATSVAITTTDTRKSTDRNGRLIAVNLFSADLAGSDLVESVMQLESVIKGNDTRPVWTSSNPSVVSVEQDGLIRGHKEGTAVVTCSASDGSGRKASVRVTVRVPVSSLSVLMGMDVYLTPGKSLNLSKKAVYGNTYGKPTMKKVSAEVKSVSYTVNDRETDITEEALRTRAVRLNGTTLITGRAIEKLADLTESDVKVVFTLTSRDGTGYSAEGEVYIGKPVTHFLIENNESKTIEIPMGWNMTAWIWSDISAPIEVKASQPEIATGYMNDQEFTNKKETLTYQKDGKTVTFQGYRYPIVLLAGKKAGTTVVTVRILDGSNKKVNLKIRTTRE